MAKSRNSCRIAPAGAFCPYSEVERAILIRSLNYQDLQVMKLLESSKVSCRIMVTLFPQWLPEGIKESLKVSPGRGSRPLKETEVLNVWWQQNRTHPSDSCPKFLPFPSLRRLWLELYSGSFIFLPLSCPGTFVEEFQGVKWSRNKQKKIVTTRNKTCLH